MKQLFLAVLLSFVSLTTLANEQQVPTRRTNGSVSFKQNFCACNDQRSILLSSRDCESFCLEKETYGLDMLYFEPKLRRKAVQQGFRNVSEWCSMVLEHNANPQCVLEVRSISGLEPAISFALFPQDKFFKANISALESDKTYLLNLKELTSGAKSDSILIQKRRTR